MWDKDGYQKMWVIWARAIEVVTSKNVDDVRYS